MQKPLSCFTLSKTLFLFRKNGAAVFFRIFCSAIEDQLLLYRNNHKSLNHRSSEVTLLFLQRESSPRRLHRKLAEKKRTILVIDDNSSISRTLNRILSRAGYSVDVAGSGGEATEKFTVNKYDAAIIDVGLGDMQGTDLLPQMRKNAPRMLRIILTGTPMIESTLDEAKSGAHVFLLKPVAPETILGILKDKLKSS
jgi:CheY-like chemotaxis protein